MFNIKQAACKKLNNLNANRLPLFVKYLTDYIRITGFVKSIFENKMNRTRLTFSHWNRTIQCQYEIMLVLCIAKMEGKLFTENYKWN